MLEQASFERDTRILHQQLLDNDIEVDKLRHACKDAEMRYSTIQANIAQGQDRLKTQEEQITMWQQEVVARDEHISRLDNQIKTLMLSLDAKNKREAELHDEANKLHGTLSCKEAEIEAQVLTIPPPPLPPSPHLGCMLRRYSAHHPKRAAAERGVTCP